MSADPFVTIPRPARRSRASAWAALLAAALVTAAACGSSTVQPGAATAGATTAAPTVTAAPTPSPTPQSAGSFTATVANRGYGKLPHPGTFQGQAPVDCLQTNGKWHGSFLDPHGVNDTREVTINESPGWVSVDTVFLTEGSTWLVHAGYTPKSAVTVTVKDDGGNAVTISVHASDEYKAVDASVVCSSVVRG